MLAGVVPMPPVARLVGFRLVSAEPEQVVFEMEVDERHTNPMGTLHGGILCDVADAAMGVAYLSGLSDEESFTTLELKINFLRPFWKGRLTATGKIVSRGRTVGLAECTIVDDRDRLIAKATSTCLTLRGDDARGR
jgi:uncharacterized protein (TIGR00369 family)